ALSSYKAGCIGSGRSQVIELFEDKFKDNMSMEDAVILGLKGLKMSSEDALTPDTVEIGIVKKGKNFERLDPPAIKKYLDKL
ncbi:MAG: proteasome subunit alpha, partial [Thermoplasmata archaeon]|nr:proteasome subunit alpha [Thermoplasmata archaeon]